MHSNPADRRRTLAATRRPAFAALPLARSLRRLMYREETTFSLRPFLRGKMRSAGVDDSATFSWLLSQ